MGKQGNLTEADILRRIKFILDEAKAGLVRKDQTVAYAMRVVSNFYTIGRDAASAAAKWENTRRSAAAHAIILEAPDKSWHKSMVNEHQDELEGVWKWICKNKESLTAEEIAARFRQYPMIVVTAEEDAELRKHKGKPAKERYEAAGIKVVVMQNDGSWSPID